MQTLKEARMDAGITQKAMANRLGVSRQTYAVYEKYQGRMTIEQAVACCDFLHRPMSEIFFPTKVK